MTTFFVIGCVGVALLLISILVGDLLDGVLDFGGELFSGAALAGFLGAFGFAGALGLDATDHVGLAVLIGLAAGVVVGAGAGFVSMQLRRGGDESNVRTSTLVGRDAVVGTAIPADGFGDVSIGVSGHITKLNARSAEPLSAGTPVTITAVLSATSVQVARRQEP